MLKYLPNALLVLVALAIVYGVYSKFSTPSPRASRLDCQEEVACFERRMAEPATIQQAQTLLKSGAYRIASSIQPAKYMTSRLFGYVDTNTTDRALETAIARIAATEERAAETNATLLLDYLIYENDKEDPGKKNKKAKLYEGYLNFAFKLEGETLYKFQIDFMDPQGRDIPKRFECAVRSFMTLR